MGALEVVERMKLDFDEAFSIVRISGDSLEFKGGELRAFKYMIDYLGTVIERLKEGKTIVEIFGERGEEKA